MTLKNNCKLHILDLSLQKTKDVLESDTLKELAKLYYGYCQIFAIEKRKKDINKDFEDV